MWWGGWGWEWEIVWSEKQFSQQFFFSSLSWLSVLVSPELNPSEDAGGDLIWRSQPLSDSYLFFFFFFDEGKWNLRNAARLSQILGKRLPRSKSSQSYQDVRHEKRTPPCLKWTECADRCLKIIKLQKKKGGKWSRKELCGWKSGNLGGSSRGSSVSSRKFPRGSDRWERSSGEALCVWREFSILCVCTKDCTSGVTQTLRLGLTLSYYR